MIVKLKRKRSEEKTINKTVDNGVNNVSKKIKINTEDEKPRHTLYIKNLNDKVKKHILKHNLYLLFSTFGDVIEIRNNMRGQAHVVLESVFTAKNALNELNSKKFFNKQLKIEYSKKESKVITMLREEEEKTNLRQEEKK